MGLSLKYIGCDVLRTRGEKVTAFGEALARHLPRMIDILHAEGGVGLAAPQVGLSQHFFIVIVNVDDEAREEDEIVLMANAEIREASKEQVVIEEGCLSIPGLRADVKRPERIRIAFQDIRGERGELETGGLLARIIQHELDHCEGVLFIDRLSPARRAVLKRRLGDIERDYAPRN
ncbi:peptide deformylase [bacterium]|nr:peptide deformylase [bacterium]